LRSSISATPLAFFGQDILTEGLHHQRALIANYLTVGHMEDRILVELSPKQKARVVEAGTGREIPPTDAKRKSWINETVAHYQIVSSILRASK
jgi:hypothetical protein